MTSGQETERVYSYNPGARIGHTLSSVIRLCDIKKITELTEEYHFKIVLVACSQEYTTTSTKKHDIKVENKLQHHHILLTSHWLTVQSVKLTEKLVG